MGSQLAQFGLIRAATWLAAAMLALPSGFCACPAVDRENVASTGCAGHNLARATDGTRCRGTEQPPAAACCHRAPSPAPADSHQRCTCHSVCCCDHNRVPEPPVVPTHQASPTADQLFLAQLAVSTPVVPTDLSYGSTFAPSRDERLAAGSALERCIALSRLTL